jgi:hypothetical protein
MANMPRQRRHNWLFTNGFGAKRRVKRTVPLNRRLSLEPLEDRHLLTTITVNSLLDNGDGSNTTFREAVDAANGDDTIVFAASLFSGGPATIQLSSTGHVQLDSDNLIIQGPSANLLTIRAHDPTPSSNNSDGRRVLLVSDGSSGHIDVTISGLTIAGGDPQVVADPNNANGGGIRNVENLTIINCIITDNFMINGGGLSHAPDGGTLTIEDSTISGNRSERGAGLFIGSNTGSVIIRRSVFNGNVSQPGGTDAGDGGAIATTGTDLILEDSTISGNSARDGGGLLITGPNGAGESVDIIRSSIVGNYAQNSGGGINSISSTLTITDSTISGNTAGAPDDELLFTGLGGGVAIYNGSLTVSTSTISGNAAGYHGGAVFNQNALVTITNSTISGNSADDNGGGFYNHYTSGAAVTMRHSTIAGNSVGTSGSGGGIKNGTGATNVVLNHTIVAGNSRGASRDDVSGSFTVARTLLGDSGSASITHQGGTNTSIIGTTAAPIDAMLGLLADNGGSTETHALLTGSPAIDNGDGGLMAGSGTTPTFDQRGTGFPRIVDGNNNGTSTIDIGAYEAAFANNPPTNPTAVALAAINEDTQNASNSGTLVAAIVTASGSTDQDANSLGIAVTAAANANGQWQYSTNAGGIWLDLSSVSATTARLLAPTHLVRFVPNADFNSQVAASPTIGFKVWDQTSGTAGSTGDTTNNNAFSASGADATLPVIAVNDAPSFNLATALVQSSEDAGAVTVNGFANNIARGPAMATDEASQNLTFLVSVTGTTGNLAFTSAPAINSATGALTFTSASNTNGTATIQVVLQDNGSGTPPNINTSATQSFTIDVAAVNDEQILATNNGLTLDRGTTAVIATSLLETGDVDDIPADLVYTVTSIPNHGALLVSGMAATQFTQQQINAGLVSFQHDGTATLNDNFGFTVDDGEGSSSSATFQITIRPLAGDYNGNGIVSAADYVVWRKLFGATVPAYSGPDGNGDTSVDDVDYTVWTENYGEELSPGAGSGSSEFATAASALNVEGAAMAETGNFSTIQSAPAAVALGYFDVSFIVRARGFVSTPEIVTAARAKQPGDLLLALDLVFGAVEAQPLLAQLAESNEDEQAADYVDDFFGNIGDAPTVALLL